MRRLKRPYSTMSKYKKKRGRTRVMILEDWRTLNGYKLHRIGETCKAWGRPVIKSGRNIKNNWKTKECYVLTKIDQHIG